MIRLRATALALVGATAALLCFPVCPRAETPNLVRDALDDLLQLETNPHELAPEARTARLQRGVEAVQRARLAGNRDGDPALESSLSSNAALLLRLRVLEAQATAWERWSEGIASALEADSLAAALHVRMGELTAEDATLVLAAGLTPPRREMQTWTARLYEDWRRRWFAPDSVALDASDVLRFHWLAQRDARVLDDVARRPPRSSLEATLATLARAALAGTTTLVAADDAGRRLALAMHALASDGAIAPRWVATAARAADFRDRTPAAHRARMHALDSLQAHLGATHVRATPILGTRHDYYRKPGTRGPALSQAGEARARVLAERALAALRVAAGDVALAAAGVQASVEVEPVEIVPSQSVAYTWTLASAAELARLDARVRVAGNAVAVAAIFDSTSAQRIVRTRFITLGPASIGTVLTPQIGLLVTLPDWGAIEVADRVPVRVVAPIQASLAPVGGPVVHGASKTVEAIVTSRAPEPIVGSLRVTTTTDFNVAPARSFQFDLRRPGQSARATLELGWPAIASPGSYDVAVKLEVGREVIGTLRTRLVRPMHWAIAGPFSSPNPDRTLAPENGVDLEARFPGSGGVQTTWQAAPPEGYDADGALDLEALFPGVAAPACAVAFTVIESPVASLATLRIEGANRVRWNGRPVGADGRIQLDRGRNTLLARTSAGKDGWRLLATISGSDGEPLRILANDLGRLLDGFDRLGKAAWRRPGEQPTDRLVTLRYRTSKATEVSVLGVFNAWVPQTLARQPDGTWMRDLRLMPGRYPYKLLVDGRLRPDPEAPASEPDGFGGRNSLLIVR